MYGKPSIVTSRNTPARADALYAQWHIARTHGGLQPKLEAIQVLEGGTDQLAMFACIAQPGKPLIEIRLPGPAASEWCATVERYRAAAGIGKATARPTMRCAGITVAKPWAFKPWYEQHVRQQIRALFKPMPASTCWVPLSTTHERIAA